MNHNLEEENSILQQKLSKLEELNIKLKDMSRISLYKKYLKRENDYRDEVSSKYSPYIPIYFDKK